MVNEFLKYKKAMNYVPKLIMVVNFMTLKLRRLSRSFIFLLLVRLGHFYDLLVRLGHFYDMIPKVNIDLHIIISVSVSAKPYD